MRSFPLAFACATLVALPVAAQTTRSPNPTSSPKPTKVVARNERLVTARTSTGGTQSYNCKTPENRKRKVCKR